MGEIFKLVNRIIITFKKITLCWVVILENCNLRIYFRSLNQHGTNKIALNGWLTGFLKRHAIRKVQIDEQLESADANAAKNSSN